MSTQTKLINKNIFSKLFAAFKNRKKNPDWARVDEPETLLRNSQFIIYGIVITAFLVLLTWGAMSVSPVQWVAAFLASQNSALPFDQLYASFGAAIIILVNLLVTVVFVVFAPSSNDDIVEMISDLDANTQERFVELENTINVKVSDLESKIDDATIGK